MSMSPKLRELVLAYQGHHRPDLIVMTTSLFDHNFLTRRRFRLLANAIARLVADQPNEFALIDAADGYADDGLEDDSLTHLRRDLIPKDGNAPSHFLIVSAVCFQDLRHCVSQVIQRTLDYGVSPQQISQVIWDIAGDPARPGIGKYDDFYLNLCGGCTHCDHTGYSADRNFVGNHQPCPACCTPLADYPTGRMAIETAQIAYQENDFSEIKIVADMLEEAGCTGPALAHLRSPGRHSRGCWAIDLVIGKDLT